MVGRAVSHDFDLQKLEGLKNAEASPLAYESVLFPMAQAHLANRAAFVKFGSKMSIFNQRFGLFLFYSWVYCKLCFSLLTEVRIWGSLNQ